MKSQDCQSTFHLCHYYTRLTIRIYIYCLGIKWRRCFSNNICNYLEIDYMLSLFHYISSFTIKLSPLNIGVWLIKSIVVISVDRRYKLVLAVDILSVSIVSGGLHRIFFFTLLFLFALIMAEVFFVRLVVRRSFFSASWCFCPPL